MSFLGNLLTGFGNRNDSNRKTKDANADRRYLTDQARRDYEAELRQRRFIDEGRMRGIDFLGGVAQARGYNAFSPEMLESLKEGGIFEGVPSTERIVDRPRHSGESILNTLLKTSGSTLTDRAKEESRAASEGYSGLDGRGGSVDGGDFKSYQDYLDILGRGSQSLPTDEFRVSDVASLAKFGGLG